VDVVEISWQDVVPIGFFQLHMMKYKFKVQPRLFAGKDQFHVWLDNRTSSILSAKQVFLSI
jgi:hypothetical protein